MNETLKQYLARFNVAIIQVNDLDQKDSLALSRPTSMTEIQARAEKHVEAEEDKEDRISQREVCVEKYTSLKATRAQILKEVYHLHLLNIPPPIERQLGLSREEWCEFHQTHGHMIEECRLLRVK
ncbi:hypothetical protein CR513_56912, partial [Mucuna pruriens]